MLIDLHAHTSGISKCCKMTAEQIVEEAKKSGHDGIVLTNHYQKNYVTDGNYNAFAERYVEEFRHTKACGDRTDLKVFFGIEVTTEQYPRVHLLIYGVDESFILDNPTIFDNSQEEIYRTVKQSGGVLIQAHPYRGDVDRLLDTALLDGIEISCHPLYEGTHIDALTKIAEKDGLILTAGGDFHADTRHPHCGMYLPETVKNGKDVGEYLKNSDTVTLCVQEVTETYSYDVTYTRKSKGGAI